MPASTDDANRVRDILKPAPIRGYHVPRWLQSIVRDVAPKIGVDLTRVANREPFQKLSACLQSLGGVDCTYSGSLDHCGSWRTKDAEGFCGEPYRVTAADVMAWQRFAELAGLTLDLSPNSWWFPGRTIRIGVSRKRV